MYQKWRKNLPIKRYLLSISSIKTNILLIRKSNHISSENIESAILKNIGKDSIISLYGSEESSWEATVYVIDIAKQNDFKISLNGNKK